ncbi:hypothetical protein ONE63_001323 [Megalurothrips usitatus]|uniref:Uncharacterized protein n=1 Tax=Megalurothrips usitatus TaxID=439358 RepID=A0AAV7XG57_9NEOP|nr:hypothetical protein ONE63_001323 [Megalurothrips usitatus]
MKENGYGSDYHRLQAVYLGWLSGVALRLNKTAIVWQEAVAQGHEGLLLRNRVIAQVWYGTIFSSSMHTVKQVPAFCLHSAEKEREGGGGLKL